MTLDDTMYKEDEQFFIQIQPIEEVLQFSQIKNQIKVEENFYQNIKQDNHKQYPYVPSKNRVFASWSSTKPNLMIAKQMTLDMIPISKAIESSL